MFISCQKLSHRRIILVHKSVNEINKSLRCCKCMWSAFDLFLGLLSFLFFFPPFRIVLPLAECLERGIYKI